jgi:superfamily II DNA or RNA helicase
MREKIQKEALDVLKENNFTGVVCFEMGTGKSKLGIDAIKEGEFKRVLITSPRTNLKENWRKELEKWNILYHSDNAYNYRHLSMTRSIDITIENIQTCYKWDENIIKQFDLIIYDEAHTCGEEYFRLIDIALKNNQSVIGLTGTPNKEEEFKSKVLYKSLPILYEYYDSAKDGLINKRKYFLFQYELSDEFKVEVKAKARSWKQGEKSRYVEIERIFNESKETIEKFYFNQIKSRVNILLAGQAQESYKRFFVKLTSRNLDYFREIYWNMMKSKKAPYNLYKSMRFLADEDYAKFGMKADFYARKAPEPIRSEFYKYIWARNERKKFLLNLESSAFIARAFKHKILESQNNKVLIFSELTDQCKKISTHSIHSKNKKEENDEKLSLFDSGEIRELSSCNSLTLGLNLIGANWAIMESYNSSETSVAQKMGRTNRLNVEDVGNVIIIVPKNTQAEEWFKTYSSKMKIENPEIITNIKNFNT